MRILAIEDNPMILLLLRNAAEILKRDCTSLKTAERCDDATRPLKADRQIGQPSRLRRLSPRAAVKTRRSAVNLTNVTRMAPVAPSPQHPFRATKLFLGVFAALPWAR